MRADSFGRLVRAEWTKFRSVRRWVIATVAAGVLPVLLSTYFATLSSTNANEYPDFVDQFHFVHQPLRSDGTVVARVASQSASHERARAGLMVKQQAVSGAPYAAVYVTPGHGVALESDFDTVVAGSAGAAPTWLRLTRAGATITADESADGTTWTPVGTVTVSGLAGPVEVGLFVSSPGVFTVERQFGSTRTGDVPTLGTAVFDNVSLTPAGPGPWRGEDIGEPLNPPQPTGTTETDGTFSIAGSGSIARVQPGDDDVVVNSLSGVLIGLIVMVVVATLFVSSEFRRGLIRTTFLASPRRGLTLAAKAVVIMGVSFVAGLIASVGSYVLARPALAENGYTSPSYPVLPLSDPTVLRAILGSGLLLALAAALSLALGTLLRRSAAAITLMVLAFFVSGIVASALPLNASLWLGRVTPMAGLAIQQTRPRWDTAIAPWAGLGVLAAYAVVVLAVAVWRLRRRDA
jgi:hypothetical protein